MVLRECPQLQLFADEILPSTGENIYDQGRKIQ